MSYQRRTSGPSEIAPGLALAIAAIVIAILATNSFLNAWYWGFWERGLAIGFDGSQSIRTLNGWIDVALIPLLFAHLGMRMKREFLDEDSRREWGIPPRIGGAIGSAMIPAGLYAGAVLTAIFASNASVSAGRLEVAAAATLVLVLLNRFGIHRVFPYVAAGIALWLALLDSGVHPALAGVALALAAPATKEIPEDDFFERSGLAIEAFEQASGPRIASWQLRQQDALRQLETVAVDSQMPLIRIEAALRGITAILIIPIFLLANAGVKVPLAAGSVDWSVAIIVALGILAVRVGISLDVAGRRSRREYSQGWWGAVADARSLGGAGITMSFFVAKLIAGPWSVESAKVGILFGWAAVWAVAWTKRLTRGDGYETPFDRVTSEPSAAQLPAEL